MEDERIRNRKTIIADGLKYVFMIYLIVG